MKTIFSSILICLAFTTTLLAQSFTGKTGYIFVGDTPNEFTGSIEVLTGVLKKGATIDVYAETGRKFTLVVTKMDVKENKDASEAKAGQNPFVYLHTTDNASGGDDYLREKYMVYPHGFKPTGAPSTASTSAKAVFAATIDGKTFKAGNSYKGALLYRKGIKNYQERPFLQLSFASIQSPDTRQLLIQVFNPKESAARYGAKDMEINFSGTIDGNKDHTTIYGFVNGKADTEFTLEITKWQKVSDTKAVISGKVYGDLREVKILGRPKLINKFANGSFENVEVEIHNEEADMKRMMQGKPN
jgi:hypothetical protein